MAFKTLAQLRAVLNDELGLASDADNKPHGTTTVRNGFLTAAIAKLWPEVALLTRENVLTVLNQQDYTLTTLVDIERLEVIDPATATVLSGRIRSWQLYEDETGDPPIKRLLLPGGLSGGLTVRAIGYRPYLSVGLSDGSTLDIPPRLEWLVIAGARYEAWRRAANSYAAYERFQNENRSNAVTAADLIELMRDARSEWQRGLKENARNLTGAHRAMLNT